MSNNIDKDNVLLVGAGRIAKEYAKVLQSLDISFIVVGRGKESVDNFIREIGVTVYYGGIDNWCNSNYDIPKTAIVAVNIEELANTVKLLLKKGVKKILVEKPAGINKEEINEIAEITKLLNAEVFVAFNRRFYTSVIKALEIINDDNGVTSFYFDFTEWSHVIEKNTKINSNVKKHWFYANSLHVVDLAFYLGGLPIKVDCFKSGELYWHPFSSKFAGAGITEKGSLFSYHANWEAPGQWKIEILTRKNRLILSPLEELYAQKIGFTSLDKVELDDSLDRNYKPGFFRQIEAFMFGTDKYHLLSIEKLNYYSQHIYSKIAY